MKHARTLRESMPQLHALLPSAGIPEARPVRDRLTPHEFVRFEEVPADQLARTSGSARMTAGQALIYRCEVTGAERRWGMW